MISFEGFILVSLTLFCSNCVWFIFTELVRDYISWKRECEKFLLSASHDYCMCGDRIDNHKAYGDHAPLSEYEWAIKNLPELKLG